MKVAFQNNDGKGKEKPKPLLPLVPEELDKELDRSQTATFKLYSDPTDATSAKYEFTMAYIDGDESVREILTWVRNAQRVAEGLGITDGTLKLNLHQKCLRASMLTAFKSARQQEEDSWLVAQKAEVCTATAGNDAAKQAAADAVVMASPMPDDLYQQIINKFITFVLPNKVLQKVKRFMRRECRKPATMKVRQFANHLHRINFEEIPMLPPHGPNQSIASDEMLEIITYAVPRSWIKEMEKQGGDPLVMGLQLTIQFFEQIEASEDFDPDAKKVSNGKNSDKGKKKPYQKGGNTAESGDKFCHLHGKGDHTTEACRTLKKQRTDRAQNKKDNASGNNKNWRSNANKNNKSAQKELAAFMKKTQKELNTITSTLKKRKNNNDEESDDGSINAFERMDMSAFNYRDMDNLKIDSEAEDGEIEV